MSGSTLEMPPLDVAARILLETTERLASEVVLPDETTPQWSELHWAIAPASAAIHGISSLLRRRLQWTGPSCWRSFLEDQHTRSELRHRKIGAVLEDIDVAMRDSGTPAIALKGSALRQLDLYPGGERPMSDIDLLVRESDLDHVEQALERIRYRRVTKSRRHLIYKPEQHHETHGFGEHENNSVPIEVHTTVAESLPMRAVDITATLWHEDLRPGLNLYGSRHALLLHLLLHAAGNMRRRTLRQIQLHDIALLLGELEAEDWEQILRSHDDGQRRWWLYPVLAITQRYYEDVVPEEILVATRRMCTVMLRTTTRDHTLTEVSFSDLRIPAFPGLTWSQTPLEAWLFVWRRIAPSRLDLKELGEDVEANPRLKQLPWYDKPHSERIFRWLCGRAPRVQTLLSVREAIGSFGGTAE